MTSGQKAQYIKTLHEFFGPAVGSTDTEQGKFSYALSNFVYNNAQDGNALSHPQFNAEFTPERLRTLAIPGVTEVPLSTTTATPGTSVQPRGATLLPWPQFYESC